MARPLRSNRTIAYVAAYAAIVFAVVSLSGCGKSAEQRAAEEAALQQRAKVAAQAELDADQERLRAIANGAPIASPPIASPPIASPPIASPPIASPSIAGPFGLGKGLSLQQIEGKPQQIAPGKYKVTDVPTPHSAFEYYILQIGPQSGLCWIKAAGKNIRTSVYGIELKSAYDEMKGKLAHTYGSPKDHDFLMPGSIWNDPKDWMMALLKKERTLGAVWDKKSGATLPPDMKSVGLFASALRTENGVVSVEYAFVNESACEAEIAKKEDRAL